VLGHGQTDFRYRSSLMGLWTMHRDGLQPGRLREGRGRSATLPRARSRCPSMKKGAGQEQTRGERTGEALFTHKKEMAARFLEVKQAETRAGVWQSDETHDERKMDGLVSVGRALGLLPANVVL